MKGLVLAIVGWRGMNKKQHDDVFNETIRNFIARYGFPDAVVSGGAHGADTMGAEWAIAHSVPLQVLKPMWRNPKTRVYDKAAGLKRNSDIVNACTHMIAFPSDKGRGTQDSIRKARRLGKIIIEVQI